MAPGIERVLSDPWCKTTDQSKARAGTASCAPEGPVWQYVGKRSRDLVWVLSILFGWLLLLWTLMQRATKPGEIDSRQA